MQTKMIVLTGGPGGGKSTSLARLYQDLTEKGVRVGLVPEAATLKIMSGIAPGRNGLELADFQSSVLATTLHLEDGTLGDMKRMKPNGKSQLIICDRGTMDGLAYTEAPEFQRIARKLGTDVGKLWQRYDAVIHLASAACGAENHYTLENNAARSESVEQARNLDAATRNAWHGHPHHKIIPSMDNFDAKYRMVLEAVCNVLGIPTPREIERRWLLKRGAQVNNLPVQIVNVGILQHYLSTREGEDERRLRSWGHYGGKAYFHTTKSALRMGVRNEPERMISQTEYVDKLADVDTKKRPIKKSRRVFFVDDRTFELDIFVGHLDGLGILEVEINEAELFGNLAMPGWLEDLIDKEVTCDPRYSNHHLAEFGIPA